MYSDKQKREYMRMFFEDMPEDFCENVIQCLKLTNEYKDLLLKRYVEHKQDKIIAIDYDLSPDRINKKINFALTQAYNSLKELQYKRLKTTN